ncbi:MAG: hypothetical protein JXO51_03990 [Candidatus Aminicenantes bacterium]|nr:hypothetical protein [Candidatus Aminicenantes bacterium]
MKRAATTVLSLFIILFYVVSPIQANELQRLVFNAAGNIGMTEAIVESQGITPANSPRINGFINTAITMLDQLAGQYNDPPFDSGQIRKIADMLRRFPRATERMNDQGRASYLRNCYTNLKSAMSTIFRSDFGLKYNATCDTFIAELGYHSGQALAGSQMGNQFLENSAKSGINLALSSGTRTRDTLGCSFLTADQARTLNVPNLKTPQEYSAMIRELETTVRLASLNLEPGFDSPATKGTLAAADRVNPPPPVDENQAAIRLVGRWKSNGDNTHIHFVQEGAKIRGYIQSPDRNVAEDGYRDNEMIVEVTRVSDRKYTGTFLYKEKWWNGETVTWTPARIELTNNTRGPGRSAQIAYVHPTRRQGNPESSWYYHRVD